MKENFVLNICYADVMTWAKVDCYARKILSKIGPILKKEKKDDLLLIFLFFITQNLFVISSKDLSLLSGVSLECARKIIKCLEKEGILELVDRAPGNFKLYKIKWEEFFCETTES